MARHVRAGDVVEVNAGKYRGQRGKIITVLVKQERVRIEGIAVVKRHLKANSDPKRPEGGIYEKLGSVHISNVQPIDPVSGKRTRVRFNKRDDGRKVRISQRSGEPLGEL